MQIRPTTTSDLERILEIYHHARRFMSEHGNASQWGTDYPPRDMLEGDIALGRSYVCLNDAGEIVGTFVYFIGDEENYHEIFDGQWLSDAPYGVVHRIASAQGEHGVATFCIEDCLRNRCAHMRIDTHERNAPMRGLLTKLGFAQCGRIFVEDGTERIAYEKV